MSAAESAPPATPPTDPSSLPQKPKGERVPPLFLRIRRSTEFRSGIFALIFSPIALILLGSSMVDMTMRTATGLPLASVEGMIGLALGGVLLSLIAINCDRSSSSLFVATICSLPIGALQMSGLLQVPGLFALPLARDDLSAVHTWSLHPVATSAILLGASIAVWLVHRAGRTGKLRRPSPKKHRSSEQEKESHGHQWVRALIITASTPLTFLAFALQVRAAPANATRVAANGLAGIIEGVELEPVLTLVSAVALGLVALASRWSLLGPQLSAWLVLVLPAYLFIPVWTTLSGNVVTPGTQVLTQVSLATPAIATMGIVLGTASLGTNWARRAWFTPHGEASLPPPASPVMLDVGRGGLQ